MSKKKKDKPEISTKAAAADLRKMLFEDLSDIEEAARELLKYINKMRHGDLDYISKIPDLQDTADRIAEDLGTFGGKLKKLKE